jgi:hypothetical protein
MLITINFCFFFILFLLLEAEWNRSTTTEPTKWFRQGYLYFCLFQVTINLMLCASGHHSATYAVFHSVMNCHHWWRVLCCKRWCWELHLSRATSDILSWSLHAKSRCGSSMQTYWSMREKERERILINCLGLRQHISKSNADCNCSYAKVLHKQWCLLWNRAC